MANEGMLQPPLTVPVPVPLTLCDVPLGEPLSPSVRPCACELFLPFERWNADAVAELALRRASSRCCFSISSWLGPVCLGCSFTFCFTSEGRFEVTVEGASPCLPRSTVDWPLSGLGVALWVSFTGFLAGEAFSFTLAAAGLLPPLQRTALRAREPMLPRRRGAEAIRARWCLRLCAAYPAAPL